MAAKDDPLAAAVPAADSTFNPTHVWAFDLGKASIGEAVRAGTKFLHKESLLIPAEFAETKTTANKRRLMRTREAHKEREKWLEQVWDAAGLKEYRTEKKRWNKEKKCFEPADTDYRLKREFAPALQRLNRRTGKKKQTKDSYADGKAKDGAPAAKLEDFQICYTSSLLRIKLLNGEPLQPWQIYKALHAAVQKRGFDSRIPWKLRERRQNRRADSEEMQDENYRRAGDNWQKEFLGTLRQHNLASDRFTRPCYYDAWRMGLWSPERPEHLGCWNPTNDATLPPHGSYRTTHYAQSSRNVRFPRSSVEGELLDLVNRAAEQLPLLAQYLQRQSGGAEERLKAFLSSPDGARYRNEYEERRPKYPAALSPGAFFVYGPALFPYASFFPVFRKAFRLREGGANDWNAALGQKIPRFDNRIINECALIPRLQVCAAGIRIDRNGRPFPETLLASEHHLLWKLKNIRFYRDGREDHLTASELKDIFEHPSAEIFSIRKQTWERLAKELGWQPDALPKPIRPPKVKGRKLTRRELYEWFAQQLRTVTVTRTDGSSSPLTPEEHVAAGTEIILRSHGLTETCWKAWVESKGGTVLPAHESIPEPKAKGRARYSRPALALLRKFILSGLAPDEFRQQESATLATGEFARYKLKPHDLSCFRSERMGTSWEKTYIPNERLASQVLRAGSTAAERRKAIADLIAEQNDPIVRHRLRVFVERLEVLSRAYEPPQHIVLEFVRDVLPESFLAQEAQKDYEKWIRDNEKKTKEAREIVKQLGATGRDSVQKYLLLRAQGFECIYFPNGSLNVGATKQALADSPCIYTEQRIGLSSLDDLRIDHIVPRGGGYGGPDSFLNKVVTTRHVNEDLKKCRTPFEWFHADMPQLWKAYVQRVETRIGTLGRKKVKLLTSPDAPELVRRYTDLAETAWIAKLAQAILCMFFGWEFGLDAERRRKITVVSGGLTARIRRRYGLDELLYANREAFLAAGREKNRDDDRHHALDAMIISFIPAWATHPDKEEFFRFPDGVDPRRLFREALNDVRPRRIAWRSPPLEETIYGRRMRDGKEYRVGRENLVSLALKGDPKKPLMRASVDIESEIRRILDSSIQKKLRTFFTENPAATVERWKQFCGALGIKKVMITKTKPGSIAEYGLMTKSSSEKRGHYKKAANHRGYFIVTRPSPTKALPGKRTAYVAPVFAFQTRQEVEARLKQETGLEIVDYFWSHCQVHFEKAWPFKGTEYPPGEYTLKTLWEQGNAVLKHPILGSIGERPRHNSPVGIAVLVEAGIRCSSRGGKAWKHETKPVIATAKLDKRAIETVPELPIPSKPASQPQPPQL